MKKILSSERLVIGFKPTKVVDPMSCESCPNDIGRTYFRVGDLTYVSRAQVKFSKFLIIMRQIRDMMLIYSGTPARCGMLRVWLLECMEVTAENRKVDDRFPRIRVLANRADMPPTYWS